MLLLPNGMGIVLTALIIVLSILLCIKKLRAVKKIFAGLLILNVIWLAVGCAVLFRPPFQKTGNAYFRTGIDSELMTDAVCRYNSAEDFVDMIIAKSKTDGSNLNEVLSHQAQNKTYYKYTTETGRVSVAITSYEKGTSPKEEYLKETESEKSLKKLDNSKYFCSYDGDDHAFCIFPIGYDGTKFLLPFVDSDGANFYAFFYFGDSYAVISELADSIGDLAMPELLKNLA